MRLLRSLVMLAALLGVLAWSSATSKASGCCFQDCADTFIIMLDNGVNFDDAWDWVGECFGNCEAHGDPSACPLKD